MPSSEYLLGWPRTARTALRDEVRSGGVLLLVILALGWGWREALAAPPPRGWRTPAGWMLGLYAGASALWLAWSILSRFALRIVPRFERPLAERPDTYSYGRSLIGRLKALDGAAAAAGATPLLRFGLALDQAGDSGAWHDCTAARRTIAVIRGGGAGLPPRVQRDLDRLDGALARGEAEGIRFRLTVVGGDVMNAMLFDRIRREGY